MAQERVERRLAAILVADVVGYSRLVGVDEEGTIARLYALRVEIIDPSIAKHHGRIVKTTGDGILVEFPSVVDAVRNAVEVQRALAEHEATVSEDRRIEFRVGVNLGDIVIKGDDILGDGVNVAARLEGLAEPGGICVSGTVREHVAGKLDAVFEDLGQQSFKNIAEPIGAYRVRHGEAVAATAPPVSVERPSVAVLPFTAMSESREHEFLADGIVEDLTTYLARLPGFLVIARNSSFAYKGQSPDIRAVGRELGVRYVVEGSLRSMGARLRVTVQLIDAGTGNHLWAEQFDREAGSIHEVHDELVAGIVGCIEPALANAEVEAIERRQPGDLDAWHYFWKASSLLNRRGWQGETLAEVEGMLRQAISLDPDFALARARLALILGLGHLAGRVQDPAEVHAEAERAIALDPNKSEVLGYAGCALQDVGTTVRGIDLLERAVELNPSNSQAYGALGAGYLMTRRYEEAIEKLEYVVRISPRDPFLAFFGSLLAISLWRVGRIDDGIERARAACRVLGEMPIPHITLAALLAQADRPEDASAPLREALRLHPGLIHNDTRAMVGKRLAEALGSIWPETSALSG